jgi:hypothetical protein
VTPERWLIVVARDRPRLYENLVESFAGNPLVTVVLDRRQESPEGAASERTPQRRQPLSLEQANSWLQLGFVLVRQEDGLAVYEARRA